jgi:hypothetical protein
MPLKVSVSMPHPGFSNPGFDPRLCWLLRVSFPLRHCHARIVTSTLVLRPISCLISAMLPLSSFRNCTGLVVVFIFVLQNALASPAKVHVITLGKWTTVQWFPDAGSEEDKPLTLKVRPLLLDTHVKEFTLGPAHDITDRLFVIRRAFRLNDSLPQESAAPRWQWQRGGWLLVDRTTGRISPIHLPDFDATYSAVSWYRDYAAYCGVSDDGKKVYAIVAQLNRRKPVLKKLLDSARIAEEELKNVAVDACPGPAWQRSPARVTFESAGTTKQVFAIRGHVVDLVNEAEEQDDEEGSK